MTSDTPAPGRAAYQASQPLLDVLQTAAERAQQQAILLQLTMEEVKKTRVRLQSDRLDGASFMEQTYVRHITTAWQGMTESFAAVFQKLQDLTKADEAHGCAEKPGHKTIQRLYESVLSAKHTATMSVPRLNKPQAPARDTGIARKKRPASTESEDSDLRAFKIRRLGRGRLRADAELPSMKRTAIDEIADTERHRLPKFQRTTSPESNEQYSKSVPVAEDVENEASPVTQASSVDDNDVEMADGAPELLPEGDILHIPPMPGVRYVDITAEVEERLRMKELRRRDTKGEMKRKRPTRDIFNPKTFAAEQAQEQAYMPATKRSKRFPLPGSERQHLYTRNEVSGVKRESDDVHADDNRSKKHKS
ncbi:hypothetical protein AMS68_000027 [Peltaster fructicola]|uniref:Uncharacterized protein n=1 Tax=Peltaster fructicola TaxID=286661 RepID=A0A6H0XJ02_9PEZI|nr:hypothetical protein AMS68_000027 [Peltaster fructicola]